MNFVNTETPTFAGAGGLKPAVVETLELKDRDGNVLATFTKAVDGSFSLNLAGEVEGNFTGTVESSEIYADSGSHQTIAADLELDAGVGTSEEGDTAFLAPIMGNVLGNTLTKENNYIAGVIAALSVLGVRASVLPVGGLLAIVMDGVTTGDGIVVAHIDGGDPSSQTNVRAAFAVSQFNNHASSGVEYGVDLKYTPSTEVDDLLSGTAEPFKVTKALMRGPDDFVIMTGAGAPVDGTTGDDFAGKGSMYVDVTNGKWYKQTAAITSPVWVEMAEAE